MTNRAGLYVAGAAISASALSTQDGVVERDWSAAGSAANAGSE